MPVLAAFYTHLLAAKVMGPGCPNDIHGVPTCTVFWWWCTLVQSTTRGIKQKQECWETTTVGSQISELRLSVSRIPGCRLRSPCFQQQRGKRCCGHWSFATGESKATV